MNLKPSMPCLGTVQPKFPNPPLRTARANPGLNALDLNDVMHTKPLSRRCDRLVGKVSTRNFFPIRGKLHTRATALWFAKTNCVIARSIRSSGADALKSPNESGTAACREREWPYG